MKLPNYLLYENFSYTATQNNFQLNVLILSKMCLSVLLSLSDCLPKIQVIILPCVVKCLKETFFPLATWIVFDIMIHFCIVTLTSKIHTIFFLPVNVIFGIICTFNWYIWEHSCHITKILKFLSIYSSSSFFFTHLQISTWIYEKIKQPVNFWLLTSPKSLFLNGVTANQNNVLSFAYFGHSNIYSKYVVVPTFCSMSSFLAFVKAAIFL